MKKLKMKNKKMKQEMKEIKFTKKWKMLNQQK